MLIDWFTVAAQLLNFLVLVWLLKRFLYQPILDAIDAREAKIAAELADADAQRDESRKERALYETKNEAFDQQRAALLTKATEEAEIERKRLLDAARAAADSLRAKRDEALQREAKNLGDAIRVKTQEEIFAIAGKVLADLADTRVQDSISAAFIRRLQAMDRAAKADMVGGLAAADGSGLVRSAFDLTDERRAAIEKALHEAFGDDIHIRFETAPNIGGGIEFTVNGQKLSWSIAEYLKSLEKSVATLWDAQLKPQTLQQ
jgi:F-type H+-transporting ATPase subunit b